MPCTREVHSRTSYSNATPSGSFWSTLREGEGLCPRYAQKRTSGLAFSTSALCRQNRAITMQGFRSTAMGVVPRSPS